MAAVVTERSSAGTLIDASLRPWRLLFAMGSVAGCATPQVASALYDTHTMAIVSIHARRAIPMSGLEQGGGVPMSLSDNELGDETLEMELSEMEGKLSELFGVEVVPVGRAMLSKAYNLLPEVIPPESWTRVNNMIAVDIDSPETPEAMARVARALDVDAAVSLRHEWSLARDRPELGMGVTAYDRCTIFVVDRAGKILWRDVVVARVVVQQMYPGALAVGLNGGTWGDEARRLARRASREALVLLERHYISGRTAARTPL